MAWLIKVTLFMLNADQVSRDGRRGRQVEGVEDRCYIALKRGHPYLEDQ